MKSVNLCLVIIVSFLVSYECWIDSHILHTPGNLFSSLLFQLANLRRTGKEARASIVHTNSRASGPEAI